MAFHFTLSGVLRLRESLERAELQRLQAIAAAVALARAELESIESDIHAARRRSFNAMVSGGLTGAEFHFELSREAASTALRSEVMKKLADLEQKRKDQQARYLQSRMQREIISNLYERQHAEYKVDQARREQQRIDELFLIRTHSTRK